MQMGMNRMQRVSDAWLMDCDEGVGVLHCQRVGECRIGGEGAQEGVRIAVGNLERCAEQHGEDEEHCELAVLEQAECLETEGLGKALGFAAVHFAGRHGECVCAEDERQYAGREQLGVVVLHRNSADLDEVGCEHAGDEAHGAEYAQRREFLHRIHSILAHGVVCHRVGDGDGGHVERYADAVEREERSELHAGAGGEAVETGSQHEEAGEAVAEGESLLGGNVTVGHDTHEGGHEY